MWERDASSALHRSTEVLQLCVNPLRRLWRIAGDNGLQFRSEGFERFCAMISTSLTKTTCEASKSTSSGSNLTMAC